MPVDLTVTHTFESSREHVLAAMKRKAADKGAVVTMTGEFEGTFVAKKLWVTLLKGTFNLADDGTATVHLTEVPPLMSDAQIRAKVLEKLQRMDAGTYDA